MHNQCNKTVLWLFVATHIVASLGSIMAVGDFYFRFPSVVEVLTFSMLGALAFGTPVAAISAALAALALGGNRPSSVHAYYTLLAGSFLYLGISIRLALNQKFLTRDQNPLLIVLLVYAGISLLSLVSLPWPFVVEQVAVTSPDQFFRVTEHSLLYPLLSVFLTCLAATLGLHVHTLAKENGTTRIIFASAIFAGLLFSITVGLADYYGSLDLSSFRPLDPIVNPGGEQFRLQSFFAHSGWYAEYVTLTIPFVLVLLAIPWPFWIRATLMVSCMLVGEFALILTYQRGGWLSYPFTLCAVWAAIYVQHRLEKSNIALMSALKRSLWKVLLSLPVTVVISLLLVSALRKDYVNPDVMSSYVDRFKAIGRTTDRTEFFMAGMLIGMQHPILGAGSESFATEFEREFEDPSGSYYKRYSLPLHGSAHNVYAQTFAGKGIAGLLSLLAIPCCLIWSLRYLWAGPALALDRKLTLLMGACFGVAFLIYGNVQEIFYIQSLQVLFFVIVGLSAAALPRAARWRCPWLAVLLGALLAAHLVWEFVQPGTGRERWLNRTRQPCFAEEVHPQAGSFHWCGPSSFLTLTPEEISNLQDAAVLVSTTADVSREPMSLAYSLNGKEWKNIELTHNPTHISLRRSDSSLPVTISFKTEKFFVPARRFTGSADQRSLAFQIFLPAKSKS